MIQNKEVYSAGAYTESWADTMYGSGDGSRTVLVPDAQHVLTTVVDTSPGDFKSPNVHSYVIDRGFPTQISEVQTNFAVDPDSGQTFRYRYSIGGVKPPNGSFPAFPANKAYNNAIAELGEFIRGSMDLSIDAFQGRQTLQLARKLLSVRKVVTLLAELSNRDVSNRRRQVSALVRRRAYADKRNRKDRFKAVRPKFDSRNSVRTTGSYWLEAQYGLLPTLSTIHDLATQAAVRGGNAMHLKGKNGRKHVRAKVVQTITSSKTSKVDGVTTITKTRGILSTRYLIGGSYTPSDSHLESLSRLTSLNPLSIAWELLPFSFVADWFYDVGSCLRGIETAMISNMGSFANGFITNTSKLEYYEDIVYSGKQLSSGITIIGSRNSHRERVSLTRGILSAIPFPRKPVFQADLGSGRLLNAAALLSQVLNRR